MSRSADMKKMIRDYRQRGWIVTNTGSGHLKWTAPDGQFVFSSSTPSDGDHALKHIRASLRRVERNQKPLSPALNQC